MPTRELCTQAKTEPRSLGFRTEAGHKAIQQARHEQQTQAWKTQFNVRAGIEGTISQGVRVLGLRHNRYSGMEKKHLLYLLTAAAMNILRMNAWLKDEPRAKTRTSHFAALLADPESACMNFGVRQQYQKRTRARSSENTQEHEKSSDAPGGQALATQTRVD
jgi:Transposase DDE domain